MKVKILIIVISTFVLSCGLHVNLKVLRTSIAEHKKVSNQIELGDTKEKVLSILEPIQEPLKPYPYFIKPPEKYIKDNLLVEIFYMHADGVAEGGPKTDDRFIPYVFNDGKLVGIGWAILGGPKSTTQPTPTTTVIQGDDWKYTPPPPVPLYIPNFQIY